MDDRKEEEDLERLAKILREVDEPHPSDAKLVEQWPSLLEEAYQKVERERRRRWLLLLLALLLVSCGTLSAVHFLNPPAKKTSSRDPLEAVFTRVAQMEQASKNLALPPETRRELEARVRDFQTRLKTAKPEDAPGLMKEIEGDWKKFEIDGIPFYQQK
jgi:hypothetical protein